MKTRITSCLSIIGFGGLIFAFGDLLIPQENVLFQASSHPEEFSKLVTSSKYSLWALRGFLGVIMEMIGTVGLYLYLQNSKAERIAFYGLIITLVHHIFGLGVFALVYFMFPMIGEIYLSGYTEVIRYAVMEGPLQIFMGVSLLSTLTGIALMAVAIWKSGKLPKWSGWIVFAGFALIPFPGVWLQFTTNLMWGAAYFWMAYSVYSDFGNKVKNAMTIRKSLAA